MSVRQVQVGWPAALMSRGIGAAHQWVDVFFTCFFVPVELITGHGYDRRYYGEQIQGPPAWLKFRTCCKNPKPPILGPRDMKGLQATCGGFVFRVYLDP